LRPRDMKSHPEAITVFSFVKHHKIYKRDRLTMGYFDNLDNEPLNKYKKIFKM
jgi:hypothetical protein